MTKIIILFLLLCTLSFGNDVIEIGDVLIFHATNSKHEDLILGTIAQQKSIEGNDPHEIQVTNSGEVYLMNIGALKVVGKTIDQVEKELYQLLSRIHDQVSVSVLSKTLKHNRIYVLGEVVSPGLYTVLRYDKVQNKLMNLIRLADGFTEKADRNNITVMRNGKEVFAANLNRLINENDLTQNIALLDADTIIVKQSFSRVYVLGQVNRPGGISFIKQADLMDYISEVGGFTEKADHFNIGILRKEKNNVKVYKVQLNLHESHSIASRLDLKEGDIIYVPKHFFSDWKDLATIIRMGSDATYIYNTLKR